MKKAAFCAILILNVIALIVAVIWFEANRSFEPALAALLILINIAGLLHTKPHWYSGLTQNKVVQKENIVGGDLSGRDMTKNIHD